MSNQDTLPEVEFHEAADAWMLHEISRTIPEVADNYSAIEAAGRTLIDEYELQPELFDDEGRALVFTSIASRWSKLGPKREMSPDSEADFLVLALQMLSHAHSPQFKDMHADMVKGVTPLSQEGYQAVADRYTDKTLTKELQAAVEGNLFEDLRKQLRVTGRNEDPYEVQVLNIAGGKFDTTGLGKIDDPAAEDWKSGLQKRRKAFVKEMGLNSMPPSEAWVEDFEDKSVIFVPAGLAEKVLNPSLADFRGLNGQPSASQDLAFVKHEYVHTQGGLSVDNGIVFGINIEEYRAVHFSGDKRGHSDINSFFHDLYAITGLSFEKLFNKEPKGGTISGVYTEIANTIGLDRMLEVLLAAPEAYLQDKTPLAGWNYRLLEYLGGSDGVLDHLLDDQLATSSIGLHERVAKSTSELLDLNNATADNYVRERKRRGALKSITRMFEAEIKQQKARRIAAKLALRK